MGELGACKCGERALVYRRILYTRAGELMGDPGHVYCAYCDEKRPDLVCRDGRVEKREEK